MTIKIYANYGVLAHEKQPVYTINPINRDLADAITVEIPDNMDPFVNAAGEIIVTLSGIRYALAEVLTNRGDDPVVRWYDGKERWKKLKVIA